jgi:hypothetical protein
MLQSTLCTKLCGMTLQNNIFLILQNFFIVNDLKVTKLYCFLCSVDRASRYNSCKWPTWCKIIFSYMFIPNLYMFQALMCSSSWELIVSIQYLVYVTVCRWPSDMHNCIPDDHLHRVTYTKCHIDTINSPDDEHMSAWNMQRFGINICKKKKNCALSWSFTRRCTALQSIYMYCFPCGAT